MKKSVKIVSLLAVLSVPALLFWSKLDFNALWATLKGASPAWILAGQLFFLLQILVRMLRFKYLLGIGPELLWKMYGLQSMYSVLKYLLPGALGEASILYLFKKSLNIEYSKSSNSLFVVRVLDFIVFAVILILSFIFLFGDLFSGSLLVRRVIWVTLAVTAVALTALIFLFFGAPLIRRLLNLRFFETTRPGKALKEFTGAFLDHFKAALSFKRIAILSGLSLLLWFFLYIFFVASVKALGVDLSYTEIFFVFLMLWPINILPIRGPGNLGTHELGWVASLSILGHSLASATLIALGTHAVFLLNLTLILSVLAAVYGKHMFFTITGGLSGKKEHSQEKQTV